MRALKRFFQKLLYIKNVSMPKQFNEKIHITPYYRHC